MDNRISKEFRGKIVEKWEDLLIGNNLKNSDLKSEINSSIMGFIDEALDKLYNRRYVKKKGCELKVKTAPRKVHIKVSVERLD